LGEKKNKTQLKSFIELMWDNERQARGKFKEGTAGRRAGSTLAAKWGGKKTSESGKKAKTSRPGDTVKTLRRTVKPDKKKSSLSGQLEKKRMKTKNATAGKPAN